MSKKPRRIDEDPPYTRYAFLNPYNLSLLAGTGVAAAATGQWWLGVCGVAGEALWLLFAPESKYLRRTWFDKVWTETQAERAKQREAQKLAQLHPAEQQRVLALHEQKQRILALANENPSLTVELMAADLGKLDALIVDFTNIALRCARAERHLADTDIQAMARSWEGYRAAVDHLPETDKRRAVAQKNIDVLEQRRRRWEELRLGVQTARGQMDLMENMFKLLADEIVTMSTPEALGVRLEELRVNLEVIREVSAEDELDVAEDEMAVEESLRR